MSKDTVTLFVGDEISDPGEQRLIQRLLRDLDGLGAKATLYANFFPTARSGQVDLLVRTPHRTAHVEIKHLDQRYPVHGHPNGHWEQQLPDGTRRSLGKNAARQALEGTWAVSDAMRSHARNGGVSDADFKRDIDTLVAIWERIPANSVIQTPAHVEVVGYTELLERLTSPGPSVVWTDEEWNSFARHQRLFEPTEDQLNEQHHAAAEAIQNYRLRAHVGFTSELGPSVDLGADGPAGHLRLTDIDRVVADAGLLALVGPSGSGKTHSALHVAARHCKAGRLVIRVRAGEYEPGRFAMLIARAMAPFSENRWHTLVTSAPELGVPLTLVLDGLNECPDPLRPELLEQVQAFLNRYPAALLVTSTDDGGLRDVLGATIATPTAPGQSTRPAVLAAHGAQHLDHISEAFQTPYDLAAAAKCESDLDDESTLADLHAAYIDHFAPAEPVRAGLRALAGRLHQQLRTSLPLLETGSLVRSRALGLTALEIDAVLTCPLINTAGQRAQFRHELLARFLAAEELVISAASGRQLGQSLSAPANQILTADALGIEPDAHTTLEALQYLADPNQFAAALAGEYGVAVSRLVSERVRDVLCRAIAATDADHGHLETDNSMFGRWEITNPWTPCEQALLTAAGRALAEGRFVDEICDLIDHTDAVCLDEARVLKAEGCAWPISTVVASTYSQGHPSDGHALAASYVVTAFELASMTSRFSPRGPVAGLARRFAATQNERAWGRLYLASLAVSPSDADDVAQFPTLLSHALQAGGYHLQLEALQAAEYFGGSPEPHRSAILEMIDGFTTTNWALQSTIVEVLSRFGELEERITVDDLMSEIRGVLTRADDPLAHRAAAGIISSQFEDENIVGPYCEAIAGLSEIDRVRLLTMGARGGDHVSSMFIDWTIDELAALVPTGDDALDQAAKAAFAPFLTGPPSDAFMPTEGARGFVAAVRGWAKLDPILPVMDRDLSVEERSWRLTAELLLGLERMDWTTDPSDTWRELMQDPRSTILVLATLEHAGAMPDRRDGRAAAIDQLIDAHPTEIRTLCEWGLNHLEPVSTPPAPPRHDLHRFVVRILGRVGDLGTVDRLQVLTVDPELGTTAVSSIRQIHERRDT